MKFEFETKYEPVRYMTICGTSERVSTVVNVLESFAFKNELKHYQTIESVADSLVKEGILEMKHIGFTKVFVKTEKLRDYYEQLLEVYYEYIRNEEVK